MYNSIVYTTSIRWIALMILCTWNSWSNHQYYQVKYVISVNNQIVKNIYIILRHTLLESIYLYIINTNFHDTDCLYFSKMIANPHTVYGSPPPCGVYWQHIFMWIWGDLCAFCIQPTVFSCLSQIGNWISTRQNTRTCPWPVTTLVHIVRFSVQINHTCFMVKRIHVFRYKFTCWENGAVWFICGPKSKVNGWK